jgi:hypothetical protein
MWTYTHHLSGNLMIIETLSGKDRTKKENLDPDPGAEK